MPTQNINGIRVEVSIIAANGTDDGSALTPRELWLAQAADTTLRADPQFTSAYPGATLSKVESNRGLADSDKGRLYLRYQVGPSATEFWAYVAQKPSFNFKRGLVGLVPGPNTPA